MCTAAAPALIVDLIVRDIFNAPPNPVSMSTSKGVSVTSVILLMSINTSSKVDIPKSGIPKEPAATPPPERYKALYPV